MRRGLRVRETTPDAPGRGDGRRRLTAGGRRGPLLVEPPGAEAVARRAAILTAVLTRGLIEADESLADGDAVVAADLAHFDGLGRLDELPHLKRR